MDGGEAPTLAELAATYGQAPPARRPPPRRPPPVRSKLKASPPPKRSALLLKPPPPRKAAKPPPKPPPPRKKPQPRAAPKGRRRLLQTDPALPPAVDHRLRGVVTLVKDQGDCRELSLGFEFREP